MIKLIITSRVITSAYSEISVLLLLLLDDDGWSCGVLFFIIIIFLNFSIAFVLLFLIVLIWCSIGYVVLYKVCSSFWPFGDFGGVEVRCFGIGSDFFWSIFWACTGGAGGLRLEGAFLLLTLFFLFFFSLHTKPLFQWVDLIIFFLHLLPHLLLIFLVFFFIFLPLS